MALILNDRVKETTTGTGTGTLNLAGAVTGFETFVAGIGNSNTTYYAIIHQTAAEFEVGLGTVTDASPDTLARTTVISSSNSDSAVNFSSGTKDVFCTMPASKAVHEDASGNVTLPGTLDVDGGITVDNITIDGTEIDLSSGDLTLDVAGDIILDADGGDITLKDGGTQFGQISASSSNLQITSSIQDKDIVFVGDDGGSGVTALTIDMSEAGSVGIGTTTPTSYNASDKLTIANTSGNASMTIVGGTSGESSVFMADGTSGDASYRGYVQYQHTNDNMNFGTAGAERMRITSNGKVGIGSTDPATDGYDYAEDLVIKAGASTNSDGAGLSIQNVGRRYGVIAFGDSASVHSGEIWYDHTANSFNMRTAGTQRFSLDSSGNAIYTGNVTAYGSVSDERLKENIEVIENPIEKIKDLKGVTFTYKKDGQKSTGLIAQDLEKVLPEAVYTTETVTDEREGEESEEHLAIRYGNTVGLLVEAIKELEARVKELEGK